MQENFNPDPRARLLEAAALIPQDLGANVADLELYWFLGVTASVMVSGFFVDIGGSRVGNSFSATIPAGTGTNNPVDFVALSGAAIPVEAAGFIGQTTGDVYLDLFPGGGFSTDFKTNFARFPKVLASSAVTLGRVNV